MARVNCRIVARAPDQGVVAKTAVDPVIAAAAVEHVVLLVAVNGVIMAGADHVFDAAQDVRLRLEPRKNGVCPAIRRAGTESDGDTRCRQDHIVVTDIARGIYSIAANKCVVAKSSVKHIVAATPVEHIVLLIAIDRFRAV